MPLPRFTVDQILALEKSCYARDPIAGRAKLVALFAGRETVDAIDIMNASIPADERLWTLCQTADADGAPVRILPTDLATLIDSVLSVITSDTEENRARVRAVKPDIDAQLERAIASQDLWHAIHVAWWYAESRDGSRAAEMARQVAFFRTAAEGLK